MLLAALGVLVLGGLWAPAAFAAPDFDWTPVSPKACEQVTFTASDVSGSTVAWDFDGDGFDDGTKRVLMHAFATEGSHEVKLQVDNGPGSPTEVAHTVDVANAPPVASFDYSPTVPDPGDWVVFHSTSTDCDDSIKSVAWDFDEDGVTDSSELSPIYKFTTPGPHDVTLTVTDQDDAPDTELQTIDVRDPSGPIAAFHRDPAESVLLETGQEATFTSDSTALPGSTLSWEIDGDAAGSGTSITHSFATPGNHFVRLVVTQTNGESDDAQFPFRVNAPPVPGFVWTPSSPVAGSEVQLYSTSVDAEGALASQAWDLDGDGQFDDASGSSAAHTFTAGDHEVSLRVTDNDGVSRPITQTIHVAAPPTLPAQPPAGPSTPTTPSTPPTLMKPFPTIRFVGFVVPKGARITLVEVRSAPRVARVTVRCTGEGCPFRSRRRVAETGRVRLSNFKRVLKAGARIEVFVRAPGVIGKYTAFRIRAGKRPLRADRCLMPGVSKPTPCT